MKQKQDLRALLRSDLIARGVYSCAFRGVTLDAVRIKAF